MTGLVAAGIILGQSTSAVDKVAVRAELTEVYRHWDKARIAVNNQVLTDTLGPDFFVVLEDGKHTRQEFLTMITAPQPNVDHLRFESHILTVNRKDDDWVIVVSEKVEVRVKPAGKDPFLGYSLWITRDCWHKSSDGAWKAKSSEWIGNESSKDKAQFQDWGG